MSGPLHGIRVLDLTSMGPYATGVMADLGADVVTIESPLGDPVRNVGPMRNTGMGATFLHLNRNKRSVVLVLKHPQGVQALLTLARRSDALVCNVRPPAMARLGLDYASVAAVNPRIVYCGVYGFSPAGRYGEEPAYDDLIQGLTAMPSLEAWFPATASSGSASSIWSDFRQAACPCPEPGSKPDPHAPQPTRYAVGLGVVDQTMVGVAHEDLLKQGYCT